MTCKQIQNAIDAIRLVAEVAHSKEDILMEDFIRYIANGGKKDLRKKAQIILKSTEIDFPRYCA